MAENSIESLIGERARDENGRFVAVPPTEEPKEPKVEAKAEPKVDATPVIPPPEASPPVIQPPVETESEKERAYKATALDERKKRQALQAELDALKKPPAPKPDFWTDPEARFAAERVDIEQKLQRERLLMSEDMARDKYKDFDEVIGHFQSAVEQNPALAAQMTSSRNPAEFAYRQGLLHRELGAVNGDPIAYRTKLEADIRAKLEAEFAAKAKPVPASLNSESSPPATTEVYAGPPPLKSILRNASRS